MIKIVKQYHTKPTPDEYDEYNASIYPNYAYEVFDDEKLVFDSYPMQKHIGKMLYNANISVMKQYLSIMIESIKYNYKFLTESTELNIDVDKQQNLKQVVNHIIIELSKLCKSLNKLNINNELFSIDMVALSISKSKEVDKIYMKHFNPYLSAPLNYYSQIIPSQENNNVNINVFLRHPLKEYFWREIESTEIEPCDTLTINTYPSYFKRLSIAKYDTTVKKLILNKSAIKELKDYLIENNSNLDEQEDFIEKV